MTLLSRLLSICLFPLLFPLPEVKAQEVHVGLGITLAEQYISPTIIDLDSIKVFENNAFRSHNLIPAIRLEFPISQNLHVAAGFNYRRTSLSLAVANLFDHPLGPFSKGTIVALPTFEFPLSLYYQLPFTQALKISVFGGLMPVVNRIRFGAGHIGDPNSPDFTPAVADALNAASTIPKKAYMNSHYGINLSYRRIGLESYLHHTLSNSLSNPYQLWGERYSFRRKAWSLRLALCYRLLQSKADGN